MAEQATQEAEPSGFDAAYNDVVVQEVGDPVTVEDPSAASEDGKEPEAEQAAEPEESSEKEPESDQAEKGAEQGDETPSERDQLAEHFAKTHGLKPEDKRDAKLIKQLVDKELHIRKIQGENRELRSKPEEDGLTEYERGLLKKADEKQEEAALKAEDEKPPETQSPRIEPSKWTRPRDVVEAQLTAWKAATEKGDYDAVIEFENAVFDARLASREDQLKELFRNVIREELGDALPAVNKTAEQSRRNSAIDFAAEELSKMDGFNDIRNLWKANGDPIVSNGREFPNTPLNRILSENPALLKIRVDHDDPDTAEKLTMIEVLRTVHRMHRQAQGNSKKSQQLLDAGEKIAQQKEEQKKRQGLNKGSGAPDSTGKPGSYVDSIRDLNRGRTKVSEMKPTWDS